MSPAEFGHSLKDANADHWPLGYQNLKVKPGFRKKVLEIIADGQWYTSAQIFSSLREHFPLATKITAREAIRRLRRFPPPGREVVAKQIGNLCQYRLRKSSVRSRSIPAKQLNDFAEGFSVHLDDLERLARQGRFEIVPESVKGIALKMRALLVLLKKEVA